MWLSTKGRYGLRAMLELALHNKETISIHQISKSQEITTQYAEQIMIRLKNAGLVESKRGPSGGYRLKKEPSEITALDTIKALDGHVDPVFCVNPEVSKKECHRASRCATRLLWEEVGKKIAEVLGSTTLSDLVKLDKKLNEGREDI
ncbi:MAG: Rrf2 family transcriptional regulator [bacterium]